MLNCWYSCLKISAQRSTFEFILLEVKINNFVFQILIFAEFISSQHSVLVSGILWWPDDVCIAAGGCKESYWTTEGTTATDVCIFMTYVSHLVSIFIDSINDPPVHCLCWKVTINVFTQEFGDGTVIFLL